MDEPEPTARARAVQALEGSSETVLRKAIVWALVAIADEITELRREVRHARVNASREARRG